MKFERTQIHFLFAVEAVIVVEIFFLIHSDFLFSLLRSQVLFDASYESDFDFACSIKKAFEEFKFKVKEAPYAHAQLSVQTRARWER